MRNVKTIPPKNNDTDIKLTIDVNTKVPNNTKILIVYAEPYNNIKDRKLNNFSLEIKDLTILSDRGIKLDNLSINLKKLNIKYKIKNTLEYHLDAILYMSNKKS